PGSATVTLSAPAGQEVQTPPCFWQNVHEQARAGISVGSGRQSSVKAMLPQWHLPRISTVASFAPALVDEHHRGLDLPRRDRPVAAQKPLLLLRRDAPEAIALVELDRPRSCRPGADQHRLPGERKHVAQQRLANALALLRRRDVRVAHERHVALVLQAHDADYAGLFLGH